MRTVFLLLLGLLGGESLARADEATVQRVKVTVAETAGIRRFGYPVQMRVPLTPRIKEISQVRLLAKGKPVSAQIRPAGQDSRGINAVSLDFSTSPGPLEKMTYTIEYGPGVTAPAAQGAPMLVEDGDVFRVSHGTSLQFVVPKTGAGLLKEVRSGKNDYLRPDSAGLSYLWRKGKTSPLRNTRAEVVRNGPQNAALRFTPTAEAALRANTVELDFPRSKSWVEVRWSVEDPQDELAGLMASITLNLQGEPALIDFGAGSYVYVHLRKGEEAHFRAGSLTDKERPLWETLVGPSGKVKPYVIAPSSKAPPAEGWAHAMDRQRCTAIALAGFAEKDQEALMKIDASGRLTLERHFKGAGRKTLHFWLHFVPMPVHVGALTSPQAMLAPLEVRLDK